MIQSVTEREVDAYNQRGYVVPDIQLSAERIEEIGCGGPTIDRE